VSNRIGTKVLGGAIAVALLFGATACGDDSDGGGGDASEGGEARTLKVCSDVPYAPMEMEGEGPRGLQYTGFDIELVDAMAESMGDKISVRDTDFDTIFASMAAGDCDLVASSVSITPEREKEMLFTDPYFDADQSLLVPKDSDVKSLADLKGQTIGVQTATTGQDYANENKPEGATVKDFKDTNGLFGALQADDIQAVLQDLPVNAGRVAETDGAVQVVETYKTDEQYGFALAKDDEDLQGELNTALKSVRDDGTYQEIYDKYFPKSS
jgi:polar amino acid transport system substrate-binding protein